MSNWSKTFETSWSHSSIFALKKLPRNISFPSFFTSRKPFDSYFQWNACTYFQKVCSWATYSDAKLIKSISSYWPNSTVFALEKWPKNLNFRVYFNSNSPFSGYFEWSAWTYFQKIYSWARYSDAKLIKNILNFLVALLPFCFTKTSEQYRFQSFFTSISPFSVYFQWNTCTYFQKLCSWKRYSDAKLIKNFSKILVALLRFYFRETT